MPKRSLLKPFIFCLFAAFTVAGQKPDKKDTQTKKPESSIEFSQRQAAIQNLILSAESLPVEIFSDVLPNLLKLVPDRQKQTFLIEELFDRAAEAKEPYKLRQTEGDVDTRSGYKAKSFALNIDALSIRLKAVRMMLALDKAKARNLFQNIPDIDPKPLTCNEALVYDLSDFYLTLKEVADNVFSEDERAGHADIYFLVSYLEDLRSSAQIRPSIDLLVSQKGTEQDIDILTDAFLKGLNKTESDPRSFSSLLKHDRLTETLKFNLLPKIDKTGTRSQDVSAAYRKFLVTNLSGIQCADSLITFTNEKPATEIEAADTLFKAPLMADEAKPEKVEPGAESFAYWRSPKSSILLKMVKKLRFGDGKTELSVSERSSQIWQQQLLKFLDEMSRWQSEDEQTPEDYLNQKCVLYNSLADLTPPGVMLATVLQSYAIFLRDNALQKESPAQWMGYVKYLLRTGKSRSEEKDFSIFIDTLRGTGSPALSLYAELEKLNLRVKT